MKINQTQIIKIHIAIKDLKINDDNYRDMLSGFITDKGGPAVSCKDLNENQANILLNTFKTLGWNSKPRIKNPFDEFANRDFKFATPDQMLKVYTLWQKNSNEKTKTSLIKFAKRIIKSDDISFWLKSDMSKLIKAVENLK